MRAVDDFSENRHAAGKALSISDQDQVHELVLAIQRLSLARSIDDIRAIVRTAARHLTGADGATFILREGAMCHYVDEDAISPLWKGQRFDVDSCVSGWAMINRSPAVIEDIYSDERVPHEAYRPTFVRSLAMVPIRTLDPVGAIGNYWARHHRATDEEVELLQALADSTAVAMENVRAYQELEAAHFETLRRLALAAEYRDDVTHEHTQRVGLTSRSIAEQLGVPSLEAELIQQAAPLHDIGKLSVPDAVLLKPGRLTPSEYEKMKGHTTAGAALLSGSGSKVLKLAQEIALTHHECWDGSGYPSGLRGEDIPLSGRIVAVADVFDALTHVRPYKPAWTVGESVEEISRLGARQFDPAIVNAFRRLDHHQLVGADEVSDSYNMPELTHRL